MPIFLKDGSFFGTLCAIDPKPARLNNPETIGMFKLFAELIGTHLDTIERAAQSEARLSDEKQTAEFREQFIAILGHDLRNPLASLSSGVRLILKAKSPEQAADIGAMMQESVNRMAKLIQNLMDMARTRLGGGLVLDPRPEQIEPMLAQVIAETRSTHPERPIEASVSIASPVRCDAGRIGELFSNLLGNAVTHGAPGTPVRIDARAAAGQFELSVVNTGAPIPPEHVKLLFTPFYRGAPGAKKQGLGLGLYIASEIARAHGGSVDVASDDSETRFVFRMPLDGKPAR